MRYDISESAAAMFSGNFRKWIFGDTVAYEVVTSEGRSVRVSKEIFDQFPSTHKRMVNA